MKILFILSAPYPPREGIGTHVDLIARNLSKKGHEITLGIRKIVMSSYSKNNERNFGELLYLYTVSGFPLGTEITVTQRNPHSIESFNYRLNSVVGNKSVNPFGAYYNPEQPLGIDSLNSFFTLWDFSLCYS